MITQDNIELCGEKIVDGDWSQVDNGELRIPISDC